MADLLLGIDFGTGGAKACLIDAEAKELSYAYVELEIIQEHPGWSEHDAGSYWPVTCALIGRCLADSGADPRDVKGVAVSSALPSLVLVDRHGLPLTNAYNLMDRRAVEEVDYLRKTFGEDELFAISGNRLEDHPVLVNLLWEKRNRPEIFAAIGHALTIDGYVSLRLTGRPTLHHSGAAFYGAAYNLRERRVESSLLELLAIDPAIIPELCDCEEVIGTVSRQASLETGLAERTPVAGGQVDCNASWVGAGAIGVGDFQSNLGTVGNFGVVHNNVDFIYSDVGKLMINFPYTVESATRFVTVPTTLTGGQTIRFLRDQLSAAEVAAERTTGVSAYDILNQEAEAVPLGCDGLVALPYLMGERTPIWDSFARGVFFGLSLNHTRGHIVRAMMEAVAFAMYDSYRLIRESGLPIRLPMVLNEGGAVSPLWRKIIADVFEVPIVLVKRRSGAPFGDAILAGVAVGVFDGFSIAGRTTEYVEPLAPSRRNHERYMEYFGLFKSIYHHLKDDFETLARIREASV